MTVKARVADYWNDRAASFDAGASHTLHAAAWQEVLLAATAEIAAPALVLDLGAGTGACALPMARRGHHVLAVDLAAAMLQGLRRHAAAEGLTIETLCADVERLDLPAARFGLVTMRNLLWTLPDPARLLARLHGMLAPGGQLLIADGYWDHPVAQDRPGNGEPRDDQGPGGDPRDGERNGAAPHPGADRFLELYLPIADQLPLYRGVAAADAERLVRAAGFADLRCWQDGFARPPYPGRLEHFVLTARRPEASV